MKLQSYNRTDRTWHTVLTFYMKDNDTIREHAARLGKIGSPEISGLRIMEKNKVLAHWNVMQGWVDHGTPKSEPTPRPESTNKNNLKHPEYTKPQRTGQKRTRPCLKCSSQFLSDGPHNRLCNSCRKLSEVDVYNVFVGSPV